MLPIVTNACHKLVADVPDLSTVDALAISEDYIR